MKKVLSVVLAVIMLACCMPFAVFAEDTRPTVTFTANGSFTQSNQLESNKIYVIPSGVTMTVATTLYVPSNTTLVIEKGGTLDAQNSVIVVDSGKVECYGIINQGDNIKLEGENASATVQLRFPKLTDISVALQDRIDVSFSYYEGNQKVVQEVYEAGFEFDVPLNAEIQINAHILEDYEKDDSKPVRDKFDDALLNLKFNNVPLSYITGTEAGTGYFATTATTGGDIAYAKWTNESDFLTTKRIVLGSGTGYECVSRYPVNKTEDGSVVVKYGEPFSFKVELDEAYDMSSYEVYIYAGYGYLLIENEQNKAAVPDAYGYYNIPAVESDITVTVVGVMKNETINLLGNLLATFRGIINMLKEFFNTIKDLFTGN